MTPKLLFLAFLVSSFSIFMTPTSALAGEGLFSRAYTVETVPKGHYEVEQTIRNRSHRAYGDYNATDFRSEFEYGIKDDLQAAIYINTGLLHAKNTSDDNDPDATAPGSDHDQPFSRNNFSLDSVSFELIYRALNPVTDPIGVAFYIEPELMYHDLHNGHKENGSFGQEFRLLLQKNFFEDQLILVYNLVFEYEYFRYGSRDETYIGEFDWNHELGATYRVAANWYAGLEARNHNENGFFWHHDHTVLWAGPAVHYGSQKFWATAGLLYQVYGSPNGVDDNGQQGDGTHFLHSHELWETTLKVAWAF